MSKINQQFPDQIDNLFKLKLYKWNVNDAIKYYKNDKFCNQYCICKKNNIYGCSKWLCSYKHSSNLTDLLNVKRDYKQVKLLCLYFMYKKVYNDKNAALFLCYAYALMKSGTSTQDYLQSEKYFLKSLSIDQNYGPAHDGYAYLLSYKFHNYDKAEYRYNKSLTINPNDAISQANLAEFLIDKRLKYHEGLSHSEKACKLEPKLSWAHYMKAKSLCKLNRFDESLKQYQFSLKLNQNDGILEPYYIEEAKKEMSLLRKKIEEEKKSQGSGWGTKNNQDSKTQEIESERIKKKNQDEFNQLVHVHIYHCFYHYYSYYCCGFLSQITFFVEFCLL